MCKTPSKRLRDAVAACAGDFNAVHDEIAWFLANVPAGPNRERLTALLEPLQALLARHPAGQTASPPEKADPVETKEG